ncbi:hypothetical protein D3C86_1357610 [compost metagenome]
MLSCTPVAEVVALVTFELNLKLKPCLLRERCRVLPASMSTPGQIRSRNSTTVTCAPRRRQTEPSSRPITPAPITTRCLGTSLRARAPVESRMRLLSMSTPGRGMGSEPVAMMMSLAISSVLPPALSVTVTLPGPSMWPQPLIQSTLFLRKRNSMPLVNPVTLSSFCVIIRARLRLGLTSIPRLANSAPMAASYSSEACSNALDGMQPTFRQVPPSVARPSTQAAFRPSCPARIAAL